MFVRSVIENIRRKMLEHQRRYREFVEERPNLSKSPHRMQWKMHEEADELLAEMGDRDEMTQEQLEALGSELADIYSYTLGIADHYGIDLAEAFEKKLDYNKQRFHPSETYEQSKAREGRPVIEHDVYNPSILTLDHFDV